MKNTVLIACSALALAACQMTGDDMAMTETGGKRLATQADMAAITGKTLMLNPGQTFVISADGTLAGTWDGKPLVGTYEMRDGFFCRELSAGPRGPSPEDCQLFILDGNNLNGTRDRGNGASFTYSVT